MLDEIDLLTLDQVAQLLHISKAHVSNVIAGCVDGCSPIPVLHLGRRKLVRLHLLHHGAQIIVVDNQLVGRLFA